MQTALPTSFPLPLLYAGPVLLNGLLALVWHIKKKRSHYTQIAGGLEFLVGVLVAALILNLAAGSMAFATGYHVLGATYLAMAGAIVALFLVSR